MMNTPTFEQFDVMTDAELSAVEGGKQFIMGMACTVIIKKDAG